MTSQRTFLLTRNSAKPDADQNLIVKKLKNSKGVIKRWACGIRKDIQLGEQVFLMRQGKDHPGIVGRGIVRKKIYTDDHWDADKCKKGLKANYIDVEWLEMLPKEDVLSRENLLSHGIPKSQLNAQSSGCEMPLEKVGILSKLWEKHIKTTCSKIHRLARIDYNSAEWQKPTGEAGDHESHTTYNAKNKFGHEDWLFRAEWVIAGWRYAFIQGVNQNRTPLNQPLDITLYTIQPDKQRRLVGTIYDSECLNDDQAAKALKIFGAKGWLKIMQDEIKAIGGNADALEVPKPAKDVLNLRFRLENVDKYPPNTYLINEKWIKNRSRYKLYNFENSDRKRIENATKLRVRQGTQMAPESRQLFRRGTKPIEYTPEHCIMQSKLLDELRKKYGEKAICLEENFIDARVMTNKELIYFEIKSDLNPRVVIRKALGQILEYAYHPSSPNRSPDGLVIVGRNKLGLDDEAYLKKLCEKFNLPLSYHVVAI